MAEDISGNNFYDLYRKKLDRVKMDKIFVCQDDLAFLRKFFMNFFRIETSVDNALMTSIIGATTTYIVVLVQFNISETSGSSSRCPDLSVFNEIANYTEK